MEKRLFLSLDECIERWDSFFDYPPPERLLHARVHVLEDIIDEGDYVLASVTYDYACRLVNRAAKRGVVTPPQAWVLGRELDRMRDKLRELGRTL